MENVDLGEVVFGVEAKGIGYMDLIARYLNPSDAQHFAKHPTLQRGVMEKLADSTKATSPTKKAKYDAVSIYRLAEMAADPDKHLCSLDDMPDLETLMEFEAAGGAAEGTVADLGCTESLE